MERSGPSFKAPTIVFAGILAVMGLYAVSLYDYLLFHTLVELFSVLTAFTVFALAWHTRATHDNHFLLFIGIGLLFAGVLDLLHLITFKGVGILPQGSANRATQFWIAFRFVFSLSFLLAVFFIPSPVKTGKVIFLYLIGVSGLIVSILLGWFPDCYTVSGLTRFKIVSEYIIILAFAASLALMARKRQAFDPLVHRFVSLSLLFSIASEFSFTEYASVYGPANMVGHLFLLASVAAMYRAIVVIGVAEPSRLLFRDLKQREEAVTASERKYRMLFGNMMSGLAYHRIVCDDQGRPVDYVFLEVNSAFETLTGLKAADLIGKGVREVLPGVENDAADWIGVYGRVALKGESVRFEQYAENLCKWYSVSAYSPAAGHFVTVFEDITERKQAERKVQQAMRRFELLSGTAGHLLQSTMTQDVIDTISRRVMEQVGCDVYFNFLVDEAAGKLRLNSYAGIASDEAKRIQWLDVGVAVCGAAFRDGCRIVAERIPETADDRTTLIKGYGIKAYACHPILGPAGKAMGTLSFGSRSRETFSEDDLSLMSAVTGQVAVAMVRMRDENILRQAEKLSRALNDINTLIHSRLDRTEMMRNVIAAAAQAIGSESAAISFRKDGRWVVTHSWGFPQEIVGLELSDDEELHTVIAVKSGKILAIPDAYTDERVNREHMKKYGVRAVLVLPLVSENASPGVLFFNYHSSTVEFSPVQLDFADKLAASVSLALENMRLFAEMESRVVARTAELRTTNEHLEREMGERIEIERRTLLVNELLKLYTRKFSRKEYLDAAVQLIRGWSGCRHVGIRMLREDGTIPYESCLEFSPDFIESENMLSILSDQCACIRVIAEKPEAQDLPAMTPHGSFYTNDSSSFVAGLTGEQQGRFRGVCVRSGFQSIAIVPIRYRGRMYGAIHLTDEQTDRVPLRNVELFEHLALILGEAVFRFSVEEDVVRQREALAGMNEQLRNLSAHVDAVREAERTNIAREIHDELGQVLTAVKMDVSWLRNRLAPLDPGLTDKTGETIMIIDGAIQSVKRISAELRPGVLDDIGLTAAMEWAAKEFQKRTGITCSVILDPESMTVDRMRSTALFRILQESLTNIMRHAEATRVTISLSEKDESIVLRVCDNGKGISAEDLSSSHSFGLIGMRERVQFLHGTIGIDGVPGAGTTVTVTLPIHGSKGRGGELSGRLHDRGVQASPPPDRLVEASEQ